MPTQSKPAQISSPDFSRMTLIPAILIRYELSVDHVYNSSVMQICAEVQLCTVSVFEIIWFNFFTKTSTPSPLIIWFPLSTLESSYTGRGTISKQIDCKPTAHPIFD